MRALPRLLLLLCLGLWAGEAQATQDLRFVVHMDYSDAGATPPIQEQVKEALPKLWQRIVPDESIAALKGVRAMSLLQSVKPNGLSSDIIFHEQRVWHMLKARSLPYIPQAPAFHITVRMMDTLGRQQPSLEVRVIHDLLEQAKAWGVAQRVDAPELSFRVQWLNDVQFDVVMMQQGKVVKREMNRWKPGVDAVSQLKKMLLSMLLQVRQGYVASPVAMEDKPAVEDTQQALHEFVLHVAGVPSLTEQVMLESALKKDQRVKLLVPLNIQGDGVDYRVVSHVEPELWLEAWFAQRGMTAVAGLEGWLAQ